MPATTFNIDYVSAPSAGWNALVFFLSVIVVVAGIVLWYRATLKKYFRRIRIFGGVLTVLIGVGGVIGTMVAYDRVADEADQARQAAVQAAWGLNKNDAAYLLDTVQMRKLLDAWSEEEVPPKTARITIDGTVQDGYLLRQGDGLLLIVNDEPVPVIR